MIAQSQGRLNAAVICCAACAMAACVAPRAIQQQRAPALPSMQGAVSGAVDSDPGGLFEAELSSPRASNTAESDGGALPRETSGTLKLEISPDSVVQYWLIIDNPNAELFTEAQLRHREGNRPAAVLFANAATRDRRVQMRGTLSVVTAGTLSQLIRDVKTHPDSFDVSVRGLSGREVIRGQLR